MQLRAGDVEMAGRMGSSSMEKLSHSKSGQVIAWCPSCYVQFTETTLPTIKEQRGSQPFEMTPFMRFLSDRLDQLTPHLHRRVELRVALHRHPGVAGVMEAAADVLQAVPGVEIVDLKQPAVGLQSINLGVLPVFKRELQLNELQAASEAGVDALVAVYHSDHRELCAHERDWPFRIINILEVVGESMGLHQHDRFKQLKVMQDADQIAFANRFDPQAMRTDPEAAKNTPFGGLIASGGHTASLMMRLYVEHYLTHVASLASPGLDDLRWLKPVRDGGTLWVRVTVLKTAPSKSKPDRGAVTSFVEVFNQADESVMTLKAVNIIARRPPC